MQQSHAMSAGNRLSSRPLVYSNEEPNEAAEVSSRRRGDRMKRRDFWGLVGLAIACLGVAFAQQPSRVWRIGIFHGVPKEASLGFAAFRKWLSELGYVEGQNSVFEYR